MTTPDLAAAAAADSTAHTRLSAHVVTLLRESVGEDRRWPDDLGPGTRLDADLVLDSLETAAFAARLSEHYGRSVDLLAFIAGLDLDAIITLTIGDVAGYLAARLHDADCDRGTGIASAGPGPDRGGPR